MSKINLKSITITALQKELRRLKQKYRYLNVNDFKIEKGYGSTYCLRLTDEFTTIWAEGESLRNIERCLLSLSIRTDKILGFRTTICCKLRKIEKY